MKPNKSIKHISKAYALQLPNYIYMKRDKEREREKKKYEECCRVVLTA